MPRPPRLNVAGGTFHVTSRGNRGFPIVVDDDDRIRWTGLLADTIEEHSWECFSWCLMTNHFHVLVRTPEPNLSRGMYRLNSRYVQGYNRRQGVEGHLLERRFRSRRIMSDWHLLAAIRYIELNAVVAGLCRHPVDYEWSSFGEIMGLRDDPIVAVDLVLEHFAGDPAAARRAYEEFVMSGIHEAAA